MRNLLYFIKEALRGFLHAKLMTFVSIATIGITLFFLGIVIVVFINVNRFVENAAHEATVVLYLTEEAGGDSARLATIEQITHALPQVDSTTLIDKAQAWDKFEKLYGTDMLQAVEGNPLPASLELTINSRYRSPDSLASLKNELQTIAGIETIQYSHEYAARINRVSSLFFWGSIFMGAILIFALHFMIANTIKLTIYARKDLVTNMHFVGATDSYIKMPFVFEGMLQGMIGGLLGAGAFGALRLTLSQQSIYWGGWPVPAAIFIVGVFFGCWGSISAVRKFLS
ncbi:MAG: cell division protein FtsX [Chitinivibrionales bacterium]